MQCIFQRNIYGYKIFKDEIWKRLPNAVDMELKDKKLQMNLLLLNSQLPTA